MEKVTFPRGSAQACHYLFYVIIYVGGLDDAGGWGHCLSGCSMLGTREREKKLSGGSEQLA